MPKGVLVKDPLSHMMSQVSVNHDGCWEWTACRNRHGYGTLSLVVLGGHRLAHVAMWELHRGLVPAGLELDHLCRNPPCCNPDHLEPVTHAVNMGRSPIVGRHERTHCERGHELPSGKGACVTCRANQQRARRAAARSANPGPGSGSYQRAKTHCPQGHPYDAVNTYKPSKGTRMCRECRRQARREWGAAKQQAKDAQ